jgi:hypothetical protein
MHGEELNALAMSERMKGRLMPQNIFLSMFTICRPEVSIG